MLHHQPTVPARKKASKREVGPRSVRYAVHTLSAVPAAGTKEEYLDSSTDNRKKGFPWYCPTYGLMGGLQPG